MFKTTQTSNYIQQRENSLKYLEEIIFDKNLGFSIRDLDCYDGALVNRDYLRKYSFIFKQYMRENIKLSFKK